MNNRKVVLWSVVVALCGFLFGFDTAVISGAEQSIQDYWKLTSIEHGFTISIALIGTVVGSLIGSIPSDRLGRRTTLIIIAVFYLISSIGTALATDWYIFLFYRFLGGLGVGASSVAAPVYISEIAPADKRGRLVALFQFNIVFGILFSYFSNFLIGLETADSWRWMLGMQAFPSLLFFILLQWVPESPRWLILNRGKAEEAKATFKVITPDCYEEVIASIYKNNAAGIISGGARQLFSQKYQFPVFLAIAFAVFNQVSGINAIVYYAPRIFEMTGFGRSSSLLSTVGIGAVNFLFTLIAISYIDRIGRKTLMLIGSFGLVVTLGLVAQAFYTQNFSGWAVTTYLLMYTAFFALSQGAVIWVFIAEIFPNDIRAKGQTLGSFTHWIMAALIAFTFPMLTEKLGGGHTFLFFCFMMVLQLLFVWRLMPETKGKSLEQIEKNISASFNF